MAELISTENTSEQILTPEDEARISELFDSFPEYTDYARDAISVSRRISLKEYGEKGVEYLMRIIEQTENKLSKLKALKLLRFCASPQDTFRISKLLERDDIGRDANDRSCKAALLETLTIHGGFEAYPAIVDFARHSLTIDYTRNTNMLRESDLYLATSALTAIQNRTENQEDQNFIVEAIDDININALDMGYDIEMNAEHLKEHAESITRRHKNLFEVVEQVHTYEYYSIDEFSEDENIVEEYSEQRGLDVEARLETVRKLHHEAKKCEAIDEEPEHSEDTFLRRHWLEYRERNPSPYAPTLGIEIEIREQATLTKEELEKVHSLASRDAYIELGDFMNEKKEPYKKTVDWGVPAGNDAFWEFAHKPVRYYGVLSREVQALIQMGLINSNYKKHSLHMTIGGVTSKDRGGQGAYVLARALEATGWSTTGGRLIRDYLTKGYGGWAIKGESGLKERPRDEIKLGQKYAVEIRTFQLQSISGLERMLRSSFFLGAALKAYQKDKRGEELDEKEEKLSNVWADFTFSCNALFAHNDLKDPTESWIEPNRRDEGDFGGLAYLIDDARKDPNGKGTEFVSAMRGLIVRTRKEIKDIMYENEQRPNLAEPD